MLNGMSRPIKWVRVGPLTHNPFPPGIGDADFDPEGDIRLLEKLLNNDPSSPLLPKELNFEELKMIKSLIDDFPPLDVLGGNSVIFSNPLSVSNEDFTFSDDESPPEADILEENFKIYSNPLFEFDEEYIYLYYRAFATTIPEKESDEVIKSSVEDLVPIPSESEDTSDNDSECDLPFCDNPVTFSNPLFDTNNDFTSSDDESLLEEDVLKENFKIYSKPLFEFDDEYIFSDVNPLFDEMLKDIENKDPYDSDLDEPALLVTPLFDFNEDECFDPGGDVDEIELLLHRNSSTPKISVSSILEGFTDETPLEENDDLFDLESKENEWKKIFYDAPIDDLMTEDKVFDLETWDKKLSPTYVTLPFEDRHYLSLTYVIRIFLPYFTYPVDSSLPLSSGSEDIIFDPGISAYSFYFLEPVSYESLMEVCSSTCFVLNITMIWGEIASDFEDSRAHGFVHRSLELQSLACLYMEIRYPRSY
ncbi:hypothetical protein Tco_0892675 [Tanacetum coccineum]|uniref:Uncharacterized protein n=1 Tax=Tanacetum coccineum TaxID=301880 RepID=A0ABQ5C9Q9_9ASTR